MIFGKPVAQETRVTGKNYVVDKRVNHLAFELEATVLWLLDRVPTFNAAKEAKLRLLAVPSRNA